MIGWFELFIALFTEAQLPNIFLKMSKANHLMSRPALSAVFSSQLMANLSFCSKGLLLLSKLYLVVMILSAFPLFGYKFH